MGTFKIYYDESGSYKAKMSLEIEATDKDEAIKRVKEMRENGKIHDSDREYDYEPIDYDIY